MFDVFYSGKKPGRFPHERAADSIEHAQKLSRTRYFWWIHYLCDYSDWDWLFEPPPWQAGQRHAWPSQWQKDSGVYLVPREGYTDTNYHTSSAIQRRPDAKSWAIPSGLDIWDTSWHPDPADPAYTYQFATQWHELGGPVYSVPGAADTKYINNPCAKLLPERSKQWHSKIDCEWDYSWRPHPKDPPYIYVFGNQWWNPETMPTIEYHTPGATERKYLSHPRAQLPPTQNCWHTVTDCAFDFDHSWCPDPGDPPYIYVFGNQWWPAEVMPTVEYHVPGATERKYMDVPIAKLLSDMTLWHVPDNINITDIDFSWVPDPGSPPYIYEFATQHQKTGGPQYHVPDGTEIKYVDMMRAEVVSTSVPVVEIDHLDGAAGQIPNTFKRIRYFDNYRDTLIRLAKSLVGQHEFVWVCSSICDYTDFDFSWHPEQWQQTMLHVFASNNQKFGDTFYMHVPTFAARAEKKALLEWYSVNYVPRKSVPRRPMPVIQHNDATHVEQVKTAQWPGPLALFTINDATVELPVVSLWRQETKNIVPVGTGASAVVVPRIAVPYIKTQLYDYPTIDKKSHRWQKVDQPMDIVFISYDEPDAEQNWQILSGRFPRAHRVHGVKGMETALEAAADVAQTPWYFAVFAKTRLHETFDFSFVPDYMQQPKHYIFDAVNTVNGLEYGHMGVVMYNSEGIRSINRTNEFGLDYTLSFLHESIPILSCYGEFDQSAYHTWRTAFREASKLAYFEHEQATVEGAYRLKTWQTVANGSYAKWCLQGANDGVEFFDRSDRQLITVKQAFRWEWLREYFVTRYGDLE